MRKIALDDIKCARWSGEIESRPAVMKDGIPCPLTHDELELKLVEDLDERASLKKELEKVVCPHCEQEFDLSEDVVKK